MPQKPARRHVLALVRIAAGLTQGQLAKLLGVKEITISRIERGTLALSEELAAKAQKELGVAAGWLLANDPKTPAISPRGGKWSKQLFEFAQGDRMSVIEKTPKGKIWQSQITTELDPNEAADQYTAWRAAKYGALIEAMLEGCKRSRRQGILVHRLDWCLQALEKEFPPEPATLERAKPKIEKLHKAFDKILTQIARREMERLFRDSDPSPSKL
jgi:transcriptional regulator with XRE-family HTH domain